VAHNHDVLAAGDRRYADLGEHHPSTLATAD
jgi:hypothetical protein